MFKLFSMKFVLTFFYPLLLFSKMEVGGVALESVLQPSLLKKNVRGSAYVFEEKTSLLVLRKLQDFEEGKQVLQKLERILSPLRFTKVRMHTGKILEVGTYQDPFLFSWVFVARAMQSKGKKVLAMALFHEEKSKIDFFNFLDQLTVLSV
jgi:hypothetical protein